MWEYQAALIRVIDGDTIAILADQGFHGRQEEHLRLLNVSAPELGTPGGDETRVFVTGWLYALKPARWPLRVKTQPNTAPEPEERRTFTRYLATVWSMDGGQELNDDIRSFLAGHPEWGSGM